MRAAIAFLLLSTIAPAAVNRIAPHFAGKKMNTHRPDFAFVLEEIFRIEGGFADLPGDTGGKTYFGISERYSRRKYEKLNGHWPPTLPGARVFYRAEWDDSGLGELPLSTRLAAQLILVRIHRNQKTGVRALQIALCVAGEPVRIDGALGPQTTRALVYADEGEVYNHFRTAIAMFYTTRKLWSAYGESWVEHRLRIQTGGV